MNLTDEDIDKILKIVEESKFDSLCLEYGDLKLTVGKGVNPFGQPGPGKSDSSPPRVSDKIKAKVAEKSPEKKTVSKPEASATQTAEEENLIPVKSPMVGTFYCSPESGA